MDIVSNDAITRLKWSSGCCSRTMVTLHFLRIARRSAPGGWPRGEKMGEQ